MKIEIENLNFKCIIGILPFERVKKQRVILNISFEYEYSKDYFIDYAEVVKLCKKLIKENKFELLEDAINILEKNLKEKYFIKNLNIKISKPDILKNCIVSLSKKT